MAELAVRIVPALLWLLVCLSGGTAATAAVEASLAGRNLILITLDTTRADQITTYGGPDGLTPHIDRIGAEGTVFENAYSQTNVTNPSHTAIFTGLYAIDSKVMNNQTSLPLASPDADTLAAAFQRAGYRTAAFVATPHVSRTKLAVPGFDQYPDIDVTLQAEQIVSQASQWLAQPSKRPFFLWLHFFDPHVPYRPPGDYAKRFYRGDPLTGSEPPLADVPEFQRSPAIVRKQFGRVRDRLFPIAMYRGEIQYADAQIGRLVALLRSGGLYDSTGIVVVADHGESLGEHDVYYDHYGLYEPSLRIPLIIRMPGLPSGIRASEPVVQIDLVPTLERLYGIDVANTPRHGNDLSGLLRGEEDAELARRTTIHEDAHNRQISVRRGPWKLIARVGEPWYPGTKLLLFDLSRDPGELRNVAREHPVVVQQLKPLVARWVATGKWQKANAHISDAELERLAALGYLDPSSSKPRPARKPQRAAVRTRRSPVTFIELYSRAVSEPVGLSSDQRSQVEAIFEGSKRDLRDLHAEPNLNPASLAFRSGRIRKDLRASIEELMDEEQRRRYAAELGESASKR